MKFIVDAQLPRKVAHLFQRAGYDALHTLDLPAKNATSDEEIIVLAEQEDRVVITKDADFVETFILHRRPPKLVVITTGNISNGELEALVNLVLPALILVLTTNTYVEISRTQLIIHV